MEKIDQQFKQYLGILHDSQRNAYKSLFKPKYQKITRKQLVDTVQKIFPGVTVSTSDDYYQVCDWETWENFIYYDFTEAKKYIGDYYDCDNYSDVFRSRAAELLNLNTAGRFSNIVTTETGQKLPHRADVIVAVDKLDNLSVYVFEAQNDGWQKVEKAGQIIKIKDWTYTPSLTEFN